MKKTFYNLKTWAPLKGMTMVLAIFAMIGNLGAQNIVDIVVASEDHQTLEAAVIEADLVDALSADGPLTLFAPTDAAFELLPEGLLEDLLAEPEGTLTDILLYHVLNGGVTSDLLNDGQMATTLLNEDVMVTIDNDVVFINDAEVITADIEADNGVIHVIDVVLVPSMQPPSVVDVVVNSPDHETLEAAVIAADLAGTLSGEGPFTLFAPTDAAFDMLPEGLLDLLLENPEGDLTDILLYHVLGADVMSTDLEDGQMATTLLGEDVMVTINMEGVFINDAQVTTADIVTDNGVVHVIDMVLVPAVQPASVVEVIVNSPDHETLEAAVIAADLAGTLSGDGPFTVFAPTDAAFDMLPEGLLEDLLADPEGALTDILLYHVLGSDVLSTDLEDGQMATTLLGEDVMVTINMDGVFINDAQVTVADIVTDNGVVHVIDMVLVPMMQPATVVEVIVNSPDHETLEAAVIAADLAGTLSGDGPFTVFAPTDAAFDMLPDGLLEDLLADPEGALTDILLYHVVGAEALSTDLSDGEEIETLLGEDVMVTINMDGVFINDAQVTVADIVTDNGVVHVIDMVLVPMMQPATVVEIIVNSPDHETLEAAVIAADLAGTLSGDGPYTVFAPTDEAFDMLPDGLLEDLLADPEGALTDILLYHVVGAEALSTDLSDGQEVETLLGEDVMVTINMDGVFINDAQVTVADVMADNGVVHVIDMVLVPAMQPETVVDIIVDSPDHETLEAAVIAADLAGTLSGDGPFTVFAPTDAAFDMLPDGLLEDLLADPEGDLTDILLYHVVGAEALSTDLSDGQEVETLLGEDVMVTINMDGVFINDAQVTVADVMADNGVVHVIDMVLVPAMQPETVVDIIVDSPDHETLEAAVIAADLAGTLSGDGPFTVFAPTDEAFANLPSGLLTELLADPQGNLTDILLYHVVGAEALSADLSDGQEIETLLGENVLVTINMDGVFINNAQVTVVDLMADNGVVHVIDAVLIPESITSVDEEEETGFLLYPNPVENGEVFIKGNDWSGSTITVISAEGRIIEEYTLESSRVDVSNLERGIYFVTLQGNKEAFSSQLLVE